MSAAVILMAYGSPAGPEDVPEYLADIREGRPVSQEAIEELTERAFDERVRKLWHADERFAHSRSRTRFIAPSSAPASMPSSAR